MPWELEQPTSVIINYGNKNPPVVVTITDCGAVRGVVWHRAEADGANPVNDKDHNPHTDAIHVYPNMTVPLPEGDEGRPPPPPPGCYWVGGQLKCC